MKDYAIEAVIHQSNSKFCYAYDENTLHIKLQTRKDDMNRIDLVWNDPFLWSDHNVDGESMFRWDHQTTKMNKIDSDDYSDYWFVAVSNPSKRFKYTFLFDQETLFGQFHNVPIEDIDHNSHFNYFNFPYINKADLLSKPEWLQGMVWYQIFVDRFYTDQPLVDWKATEVKNNIIFGGNLKGIEAKLDYLTELGIKGIYLNPIFESHSAHKYDTIDYYKVDSSFGSNDDLKSLIEKAHQRGLKIMLDGVFNHAGFDHPYFQDVVKYGKKSKYAEYFIIRDEPVINFDIIDGHPKPTAGVIPNYETFAFVANMPKWDSNNPVVREYLTEIALHYVKEYDIDGWRLDVAEEPAHQLWIEMVPKLKRVKPDLYVLGENWFDANAWFVHHQFDAVMNYVLQQELVAYFQGKIDGYQFKARIQKYIWMYPKNVLENMYNLLDSHDTERITHKLPTNFKLAYVFLFSFAGVPALYYGSEIGMEGAYDPDCRRPMIWEEKNESLFSFFQKLIQLRAYPSVQTVDIKWIQHDDVLIYAKGTPSTIFIISKEKQVIDVPKILQGHTFYDFMSEEYIKLENQLDLGENQFVILLDGYTKK